MANPGAPAETATEHTPTSGMVPSPPAPRPGTATSHEVATTPGAVAVAPGTGIDGATEHAAAACSNCGAPVSGRFCSNCGQRVEHAVHSIWHFANEAMEDLTHADSRLWSTVGALLFKPGYLTCEFLAGRRVKFLPPLRLYLVLSLLFFVLAALGHGKEITVLMMPEDSKTLRLKPLVLQSDAQRQRADQACSELESEGALGRLMGRGCHNAVKDGGHALSETYKHNVPRAIFLSLPILALALKPLYRRPRRYYVEHLLFLLHDHAFIFFWFGVYNALYLLIPVSSVQEGLFLVFALYVPYYYFRAMRRVYGDGPWLTLSKFTALSLVYLIVAFLVLVATSVYSVLAQ